MTVILSLLIAAALLNNLLLLRFPHLGPASGADRFIATVALSQVSAAVMLCSALILYSIHSLLLRPLDLTAFSAAVLIPAILLTALPASSIVQRLFPLTFRKRTLLTCLTAGNSAALSAGLLTVEGESGFLRWSGVSLAGALGFAALLLALAAMRERVEMMDVPSPLRGLPVELISTALAALALFGIPGVR